MSAKRARLSGEFKAAPDIRKTGRQQVPLCTALATEGQGAETGDRTEIPETDAEENRRRLNGLRPMPGWLPGAGGVLRRTSGALRQTEGSSRPHDAPTGRNAASVEALKPRDELGSAVKREICRPFQHLRAMSDAAGAIRHVGSCENRTPDETLAPHRRFSPAPGINSMCRSWGKPKADS
jgi:hypothetical protein